MPQLDPAVWFYTLSLSWVLFTLAIPYKMATLTSPNFPKELNAGEANISPSQHSLSAMLQHWNWPWH
uniref:ATPase subunits 8 n=1 Tax=Gonorynchus abbreviatus TaxID=189504 RepID=B3LEE9_9TELE|nr:ATP synthase F0 subunit 8 [Gonorynchus abbreviatus]BAG49375.1 ATPase subunits 8 [Gonorynchus abbreviatus]